jgi:hypothetical protein
VMTESGNMRFVVVLRRADGKLGLHGLFRRS